MNISRSSARQPNRLPWSQACLRHEHAIAMGFAVKPSSIQTYTSGLQSYLNFCKMHQLPINPTSDMLSLFVMYMSSHIRPSSVCNYLSGICHSLEDTFPDVHEHRNSRLVTRTLVGCLKRAAAPVRQKRAFSPDDLNSLLQFYTIPTSYDDKLFLAIIFTSFWALLRPGETVVLDPIALRLPKKFSL